MSANCILDEQIDCHRRAYNCATNNTAGCAIECDTPVSPGGDGPKGGD